MTKILLVTVTKVEAQAVLEVFTKASGTPWQRRFIGDKTYYALGQVGGAELYMVQSEMGTATPGGAFMTIHKAIEDFHPMAVIMVGIAFGIRPDRQQMGEILVSKQIMAYEPQKRKGEQIIPRGDRVTCSTRLLGKFRTGDMDWLGAKVHFGLVLSGEKLIADQPFRDALLKLEPEAIGGEMEGAGLYAAASDTATDWILVKAICDWADNRKDENAQPQAARNAADFVRHVIGLGGWDSPEERQDFPESAAASLEMPPQASAHTRDGITVQGNNNTVVGAGGLHIGGNVGGDVVTGDKISQQAGSHAMQIGKARDVHINNGPVYNIQGGIHAGRDIIQGDQTNTTTNITYSTTHIHSPAEFVGELRKLQVQIAALKSVPALDEGDVKMLEVVEGRVQEAAHEAQKPRPAAERITATLEKAKKTMDTLGESVTSAVGLGAALAGLIGLVSKLFGG